MSQLEKSRDAVSVANLRAAYAEAMTDVLTGDSNVKTSGTGDNQTTTVEILNVEFKGTNNTDEFSGLAKELSWLPDSFKEPAAGTYKVTFTLDKDSKITDVTCAE